MLVRHKVMVAYAQPRQRDHMSAQEGASLDQRMRTVKPS
jgi:hypothetical protein